MDYEIISEELVKQGFSKNGYGSPEKTIRNIKFTFVFHPFYHVILYHNQYFDGRTLHVPGELKLPKACTIEDVMFVIDCLVQGKSQNEIAMEIYNRLNPEEAIQKEVKSRHLDSNQLLMNEDWNGNNAAFCCPVCGKLFIVSGMINRNGRKCPHCGKSTGFCEGGKKTGGTAYIEWEDQ